MNQANPANGSMTAQSTATSNLVEMRRNMPDPANEPRRIVVVRLSHLGDVVHALPVFHALREAFPAAEIGWVVQAEFGGLLEGLPGLARVFRFERRGGLRAWRSLYKELADFRAELAVDAQGNLKSAAATLCARAPRRVGLAREDWREPLGALALNDTAPPAAPLGPHAMDRMRGLARHLTGSDTTRTDVALTAAERARGEELADELLPTTGSGAPILLQVKDPADVRGWPLTHWTALARLLAGRGSPVLLLTGPQEAPLTARLASELADTPGVRCPESLLDLRELAALFTACAERGARLVTCDSGPMHLAAASGLPVVALEGPQDAARTGPWPRPTGPARSRAPTASSAPPTHPTARRASPVAARTPMAPSACRRSSPSSSPPRSEEDPAVRMVHYYTILAVLVVPALLATMATGIWFDGSTAHLSVGLFTAILAVATQTLLILFMIVTGRVLRAAMQSRPLGPAFLAELNDFFASNRAYPAAGLAAVSIVAAGVMGYGHKALGWPSAVHMLLGLTAVGLNAWAVQLGFVTLRANQRLLDRTATELDRIDREEPEAIEPEEPLDPRVASRRWVIAAFAAWAPYLYWGLIVWRGDFGRISLVFPAISALASAYAIACAVILRRSAAAQSSE